MATAPSENPHLQLITPERGGETPDARQFVAIRIGSAPYALPIQSVREIIRFNGAAPMAGAPEWSLGVINLRGTVIPVHDLAVRLGLREPGSQPRADSKVLVIAADEQVVGMVVDEVDEVALFDSESLVPAPGGTDAHVTEVAMHGDQLVLLLDPDALVRA